MCLMKWLHGKEIEDDLTKFHCDEVIVEKKNLEDR